MIPASGTVAKAAGSFCWVLMAGLVLCDGWPGQSWPVVQEFHNTAFVSRGK